MISIPELWNRSRNWASKTHQGFGIVGAGATLTGTARMRCLHPDNPDTDFVRMRGNDGKNFISNGPAPNFWPIFELGGSAGLRCGTMLAAQHRITSRVDGPWQV